MTYMTGRVSVRGTSLTFIPETGKFMSQDNCNSVIFEYGRRRSRIGDNAIERQAIFDPRFFQFRSPAFFTNLIKRGSD
jgi:hypothetical protein